jgi:acyl-CoA synthetase (AMP-forming)/AMP-acid ligase II
MQELKAFSECLYSAPQPKSHSTFISAHDGQPAYGEFKRRVEAAAKVLSGILPTRQNTVFLVAENSANFVVALFALNHLAQVVVPVFPRYAAEELRTLQEVYQPQLIIADKQFHAVFSPQSARMLTLADLTSTKPSGNLVVLRHDRDDVCFILLTSGAHGPAKGVVLTNGNILSDIAGIQGYMRASDNEKCLITRSLTHTSTLVGELLLTALTRGCCILQRSPATIGRFFDWCDAESASWAGVAPTLLKLMVDYGEAHGRQIHLRRVVVSGAILPRELCLAFLRTFPHTELINAYGLTEASPRVAYLPYSMAAEKPGAVGYPIAGCAIRVVGENKQEQSPGEIGEIEVSGANVTRGYFHGRVQETHRDGDPWLKTGDLGYCDHDGALFVVGRIDTMLIHDGINIYPEYVAAVLEKCAAVEKAQIAHLPQSGMRHRLLAFIKLAPGVQEHAGLRQIRSHLAENLDTRKQPDEIVFVSRFPLTRSGKVDVRKLLKPHLRHGMSV